VPYGTAAWSSDELYSFLHHTVRSFLRNDLYSALTELLSRAEGSFGVTAYRRVTVLQYSTYICVYVYMHL
jgi:hypothetical protein